MALPAVNLCVLANQGHFGGVVIKGKACFVELPSLRGMTGAAADLKIRTVG